MFTSQLLHYHRIRIRPDVADAKNQRMVHRKLGSMMTMMRCKIGVRERVHCSNGSGWSTSVHRGIVPDDTVLEVMYEIDVFQIASQRPSGSIRCRLLCTCPFHHWGHSTHQMAGLPDPRICAESNRNRNVRGRFCGS